MKTASNTPRHTDDRWQILSLVQASREALGLKPRSISVLRGLLSILSAAQWDAGDLQVFASNRHLQERCDGMDERTLRRHLAYLCAAGLIHRRMSPNRKRYVVRDDSGAPLLAYGFDLTALKLQATRLQAIAADVKAMALRIRSLKAVLRDMMWQTERHEPALQKVLRNKSSIETLEDAINELSKTLVLTDSDGQTDRHIQSSKKEYIEEQKTTPNVEPISAAECIESASEAIIMSPNPVHDWKGLEKLAHTLAPALGLSSSAQKNAHESLGRHGFTLAVLGLIQAFDRIKSAPSYLASLSENARAGRIDLRKMFKSLTKSNRFTAVNQTISYS